MTVLNYAVLYHQALQQRFSELLKFNALYSSPNNATIRWINANTIQIPNITVGGFTDVDRDSMGSYTRRVDNKFTPKVLEHDREFRTLVDPMDIDETNMAVTIANITRVFNDEHKIPEMDKYMASKIYSEFTSLGGEPISGEITSSNALSVFDDMMEEMDEAEVPQEGRILYVTPAYKKILKTAQDIQRKLDVTGGSNAVNRNVHSLDDVQIISVPSSRMKTAYNFTDGAVVASGADQINMILIHPSIVISPQKYEFVDIDAPSASTGGKHLYYERKYWDVFLIEQKIDGVKIHITEKP
ncbi:hypothetical protein BpsS140_00020 [Bacillus phage vB_BpsS-140]|nr:hypothetical protein BpsS140_00020 [Bacillus phage vB_BpsS-140]